MVIQLNGGSLILYIKIKFFSDFLRASTTGMRENVMKSALSRRCHHEKVLNSPGTELIKEAMRVP